MSVDTAKIRRALDAIEEKQKALAWLTEHGERYLARGDCAFVGASGDEVWLHGANEARSLLSHHAKTRSLQILTDAIKDCEEAIAVNREIIAKEARA